MHTVLLHGGARDDIGVDMIHTLLCDALSARGGTVESLRLAEMRIHPCTGCFACWMKTPGECVHDDEGRVVARAFVQADLRVLLTPLAFGGYGGVLKVALDRMIPTISPLFEWIHGEMHHRLRYPHPPPLAVVGWQRQADAESADIFARLVERNAINMHAPVHGALVLTEGQGVEEQRALLAELLRRVEVY